MSDLINTKFEAKPQPEPEVENRLSLYALLEKENRAQKPEVKRGTDKADEGAEKNIHSVSRDVAAKPEDVWKFIGKFDELPWHPGIESGKVESKNGDTIRTLVAKGGSPVFVEQLLEKGPNFIKYKMIGGLPLQPEATISVEPNKNGGTTITWSAKIDGADKKTVEAVTAGVTGFYASGLENLQKKFGK